MFDAAHAFAFLAARHSVMWARRKGAGLWRGVSAPQKHTGIQKGAPNLFPGREQLKLQKLLESLEIHMIQEILRKVHREKTGCFRKVQGAVRSSYRAFKQRTCVHFSLSSADKLITES
ncbi:Dual Serine/Threonine And Tyrosine Protein Kinase [Manis pentadactyla]|nr:Dual Serine/Threonine And Tyrosine Protein Kinase [Manis pentadactyla]